MGTFFRASSTAAKRHKSVGGCTWPDCLGVLADLQHSFHDQVSFTTLLDFDRQ